MQGRKGNKSLRYFLIGSLNFLGEKGEGGGEAAYFFLKITRIPKLCGQKFQIGKINHVAKSNNASPKLDSFDLRTEVRAFTKVLRQFSKYTVRCRTSKAARHSTKPGYLSRHWKDNDTRKFCYKFQKPSEKSSSQCTTFRPT